MRKFQTVQMNIFKFRISKGTIWQNDESWSIRSYDKKLYNNRSPAAG